MEKRHSLCPGHNHVSDTWYDIGNHIISGAVFDDLISCVAVETTQKNNICIFQSLTDAILLRIFICRIYIFSKDLTD